MAAHNRTNNVHPTFPLTVAWADPPGGVIPAPNPGDPPTPHSHTVGLLSFDAQNRQFHFQNSWGPDWGARGTGYMPYEYFDEYVFECWGIYAGPGDLRMFRQKDLDRPGRVRWSAHDEQDHKIYAFEVRHPEGDDRLAWTFVVERGGGLEVEELYVRPEYRHQGHGRWLAQSVRQLAQEKGSPLRLWVAFADCRSESASTYPALVATARYLGLQFHQSPVKWAAYFGTTEGPGLDAPVEPSSLPVRPRAPRRDLIAAALAIALGTDSLAPPPPPEAVTRSPESTMTLRSAEWDALTNRRAELIYKKNRQGLTPEENAEFFRLQKRSREAVALAFPYDDRTGRLVTSLEKTLRRTEELAGQ